MVKTLEATIQKISEITSSAKSYVIKISDPKGFHFQAGQYMNVLIPNGEKEIRIPLSIASPPTRNGHLEFCIRQNREGILPNYFNQITEGKQIKVEGPFGQFTISNPGSADLLFVATGTGISPIRSIIFSLFSQPFKKEVWLFFGVKNEGEILYRNEFQELQKQHPNFHFIPTLSKPGRWEGEMGYVQEKIKALVKHPETKEAYICGQPLMVKEVRALLAEIGIDQNKTFFEQSA